MSKVTKTKRNLGTALAALLATSIVATLPSAAHAQPPAVKPSNEILVAVGSGHLVRLPGTMSDLFVANSSIADVQVRSTNQIYIYGQSPGETTIYATNKAGKVIYSTNVRVGNNIDSIDDLLRMAMPNAQIRATPMNGLVLLTGTVSSPADIEDATRMVETYVGPGTKILNRLKAATPLQVMLRVRIAEVSRSVSKSIGFNMMSRDNSGGFLFGLFKGAPGTIKDVPAQVAPMPPRGPGTEYTFTTDPLKYTIGAAGNLFGMNVLAALDLAEASGGVSTLAEPTLVALSGETASFLAGGEFPIPISSGLGGTSVEYKSYGVGLAFTPIVLDDGRISMRVRPEVSELSSQGAVKIGGFEVPAVTTRRAETTVELGSGQSFVIGGLLSNSSNNSVDKAPWLGDLPVLGALFRSNSFRRAETELVIVVTPYLVKPVSDSQIALPTDGFRMANDAERVLLNKGHTSESGATRPGPTMAPPRTVTPALISPGASLNPTAAPSSQAVPTRSAAANTSATPGFGF